jgi:formylglycine-generating enzyme required for sulfatase activity
MAANGFGLHDIIGSASEWTEDCWNGNHHGWPTDGSTWIKGDCGWRVVRGGSWDKEPGYARAAYRSRDVPGSRYFDRGFRLARTL